MSEKKPRAARGRHEGGVYKRADGRWVGAVSLGYGADGKRKRRVVYADSKKQVIEKLDKIRQDNRQGMALAPSKDTLGDFLGYWLDMDVKPSRAPGTLKSYSDTVRLHIAPHVGRVRLSQFQAEHVIGLYATLVRSGVPDRTRELVHSVLHRAMKRAVQWRRVNWNPVTVVERPRVVKQEKQAVTMQQANHLLKAAEGHRLESLFMVVMATGLRQGEAFGLRWQDVDFDGNRLHVRHSLEELNGVLRLKEPKSKKSRRAVELSKLAMDALSDHRKRMLAEGHYATDRPVFCDTDGGYLRKSNFTRNVYNRIRTAAGLPGLGFHQWRHFHATLMVANGADAKVLQERLGHADVSTTLRFYVHPGEESHRKAADTFEAAFRRSTAGFA